MDVTLDGVTFSRDGRVVLDIGELTFPAGSTTAVFGPNGSGKTTLLRCIAGLEHPTRGTVRLGGEQVRRGDPRIAIAFQQPVFLQGTVGQNLELGLELRGVPAASRGPRVASIARECRIEGLLDRPARALSAGESQRVSLARTLLLAAPVTLLDEPLSGFDRVSWLHMLEEIPALLSTRAATTVVVTHDREEAFRLAERIVILVEGRVRASGNTAAVYRAPPDPETAELLGYTLVEAEGRVIGFAPGSLTREPTPLRFRLEAGRVVDLGNQRRVVGRIGTTRVELALLPGEAAPSPGSWIDVGPADWVEFGGG